jgi:TfoX/Sxy family transcriptional regulator of competence genes
MAYDQHLAQRVRERLSAEDAIAERRMFGGIAFLAAGNMSVGVTGDDLMVRVGPDAADEALAEPHTRVFDMTGRPMKAWVLVAPEGVASDADLDAWVRRGLAFARSLPAKQ